jgi:hypothetical protein
MLATLPAVCSSPHNDPRAKKLSFLSIYQCVMPAKSCSPGEQPGGGLKVIYYQWVVPAAQTPRLTTCSPLAGDTSRPSPQPPSNHHQKEAR